MVDYQPDRLPGLWRLDIQVIADVRSILAYRRDVPAAMQPKEEAPHG